MNAFAKRLPSPAMVVACLALVVALSGVSYAAGVLPVHSVGSKQLRKRAVTPSKIAPKTIALFKGQQGDPGPQGPKGDSGTADTSALLSTVGSARTYGASQFTTLRSSIDYANVGPGRTTTTGGAGFHAPLDLPQGARVTRVTGFFSDNNPTQSITFFLSRQRPSAGESQTLGQVSSDGSSSAVRTASFQPSGVVVDNATRAYTISAQFPGYDPSNIVFYGVKVEYEL